MKYYNKAELERKITLCNDFLTLNNESHHLYKSIQTERNNWAYALKELEDLGLDEIPLDPKTNFLSMV